MIRKILLLLLLTSTATTVDLADSNSASDASDFTFVRLIYSSGAWRRSTWAIDYPKADEQLLYLLRKWNDLNFINPEGKVLPILSDELFEYPFIYAVEVGYMRLSDEEAAHLREYLLRGGFLVVDDFHGPREWDSFYRQLKKIFPEYEPFDLPINHPIFQCYHNIEELFQVPGIHYLRTGRTWEKGGYEARYMGVEHPDTGRIMIMINYNVDLGDAWEWAEVEVYPRHFATLAFQLALNYVIYSMTH